MGGAKRVLRWATQPSSARTQSASRLCAGRLQASPSTSMDAMQAAQPSALSCPWLLEAPGCPRQMVGVQTLDRRSQVRATQPHSGSNGSMGSSNNTTNHQLVQQLVTLPVTLALTMRLPPLVEGADAEAVRGAVPSAARAATCRQQHISLHAIMCLLGAVQIVCLML